MEAGEREASGVAGATLEIDSPPPTLPAATGSHAPRSRPESPHMAQEQEANALMTAAARAAEQLELQQAEVEKAGEEQEKAAEDAGRAEEKVESASQLFLVAAFLIALT